MTNAENAVKNQAEIKDNVQRLVRSSVRGLLLGATIDQMKRERQISIDLGDYFRAQCVEECIQECVDEEFEEGLNNEFNEAAAEVVDVADEEMGYYSTKLSEDQLDAGVQDIGTIKFSEVPVGSKFASVANGMVVVWIKVRDEHNLYLAGESDDNWTCPQHNAINITDGFTAVFQPRRTVLKFAG